MALKEAGARKSSIPRRRFGRTELSMPVLSLGTMRFQYKMGKDDMTVEELLEKHGESQANVEACVRRALSLGLNHLECARGYGTSERQMGAFLKSFGMYSRLQFYALVTVANVLMKKYKLLFCATNLYMECLGYLYLQHRCC